MSLRVFRYVHAPKRPHALPESIAVSRFILLRFLALSLSIATPNAVRVRPCLVFPKAAARRWGAGGGGGAGSGTGAEVRVLLLSFPGLLSFAPLPPPEASICSWRAAEASKSAEDTSLSLSSSSSSSSSPAMAAASFSYRIRFSSSFHVLNFSKSALTSSTKYFLFGSYFLASTSATLTMPMTRSQSCPCKASRSLSSWAFSCIALSFSILRNCFSLRSARRCDLK
ncbi:hypothetical protein KCU98_g92, partial [Aureobasidium melanogenum]